MALSNYDRVGKTMEILKKGLAPFVEREVYARLSAKDAEEMIADFADADRKLAGKSIDRWDVAALLNFMWIKWNEIYSRTLGNAERSLLSELRENRNKWAHQDTFTTDDAYRVLDSASRLLTAFSAPEAEEIERSKNELLRIRFDEQVRNERRRGTSSTIDSAVTGTLKPWREVITPHHDVATGLYQQAEFAPICGRSISAKEARSTKILQNFQKNLSDGQLEKFAHGCGPKISDRTRRPRDTAADQFRRWQDPFNACTLSSLFRN